MDSIEAKTAQLKNSIESLYTTSGMQDFLKWWTDFERSIVDSYAALTGKGAGGMIAAVGKLGTVFYNVANVVLNTINFLRVKFEA